MHNTEKLFGEPKRSGYTLKADVTTASPLVCPRCGRPCAGTAHMADCQLFGLHPGPHHLVNVALHAVNVLLLFWLQQRATGAVGRSFLVAALFAVHPLNVETVAWVAERKSLLSAFFPCLRLPPMRARVEADNSFTRGCGADRNSQARTLRAADCDPIHLDCWGFARLP